jgi:hypothetical protein
MCLFYSAWPVWRSFFPLEIDLKEPWNAYHADAAFGAGDLYPELTSLVANNYPPFWYYLTCVISRFGIDAIYVGRALSLFATVVLSVTIGVSIRSFKTGWPAAVLGSFLFLGLMVRYADWYVGMNDPNLLALAFMMIGLTCFLRDEQKKGGEGPLLLMVVGGFFKHSLLAIPVTTLWLLAKRNSWIAARGLLVSALAAFAGILVFTMVYGRAFLDQMFFYPRELSIGRLWDSFGRLGGLVPSFIIWAIWAWHDRGSEAVRFTATFVFVSLATYLLQKLGAGTDINAQFELNIALAMGVGLAFDRVATVPEFWGYRVPTRRLTIIGTLAIGLLIAPGLEPYYLLSSDYRAAFSRNSEIVQSEITRIANIPGAVRCTIDTVCRAAGKPFTFDAFFAGQKGATGQWTAVEFNALLDAKSLQNEKIDSRASVGPLQRQLFYGRSPYQ